MRRDLVGDSLATLPVVVVAAIAVLIALTLLFIWLLTRGSASRTSFGFYVERELVPPEEDSVETRAWPSKPE